jgi:DNA-binding response OmpR family regulator
MGTQRDYPFLQALARRLLTRKQLYVLIVDPDIAGAQRLADALGNDHLTRVVGTADSALMAIERRVPTLLVTELDLPDVPGVDLISRVHARADTRHMLLMVISRRNSITDKIQAFQAGADHYLVKPVEPGYFAAQVEQLSHFRQVLPSGTPS